MDKLNDNTTVLGGQISDFLKDRRAARDSKEPLPRPTILDDAKADPAKRAEAEEVYVNALLQRKTLTADEQKYLTSAIAGYLRGRINND